MRTVLDGWLDDADSALRIAHIEEVPARDPIYEDLDPPLPEPLSKALADAGIERLYRHQATAIRHARRGEHTVVAAATASGKSLGYQAPIIEAQLADPTATALMLFPTKALTRDQLRALHGFGIAETSPAVYDGDTDQDARIWARRHANVILTNPDMLHVGILPHHRNWATFLARLRFVVIDEVHVLRGIFGSHAANVLRRLRRLAAHYGAEPTFLASSATIGNPGQLTSWLTGLDVVEVDQDTSPAGAKTVVVWNPEEEDDPEERRSALAEGTEVFADLVRAGVHTIAFTRSRKGTELMYRWARDRLDDGIASRISPYRAGYLPERRREIEQRLFSGDLLGVTATNALELGIDVGGLDAAVVTTFPGTIASFRQQIGRAGRSRDDSLAVLVAGQDALDQYYVHHPAQLFGRAPEAAVVNPTNPEILRAQVGAAAYELPLVNEDMAFFGEELEEVVADLAIAGDLRQRGDRMFWARRRHPAAAIDIRTAGGPPFTIVDEAGEALGTVDEGRAFSQTHPGAVYLHEGDSYVVEDLDLDDRVAVVRKGEVGYFTMPQEDKAIEVVEVVGDGDLGRFGHRHGIVEVETRITGFKKRSLRDRSTLGYEDLDLPPRRFTTQAFWVMVPPGVISSARLGAAELPGALHAAEHTGIAMLPLFAICDRWDIGGLSTTIDPGLEGAGWYIYDGYPGGAGIAPMGFEAGERHLRATLQALRTCPCDDGCPSCVQSPKCGNFNEPLDKGGAARLLEAGLGEG